MSAGEAYLKAILATVARQAFPPDALAELVVSKTGGKKQVAAYNLCDGEHTQAEIAAAVGLDKGSLSRSISRWEELGIVFRMNSGGEMKPVHVYPMLANPPAKKKEN